MPIPRWATGLTALLASGCGVEAAPHSSSLEATVRRSMPSLDVDDVKQLDGTVDQIAPAGHYTYLHVNGDTHGDWVVVLGSPEVAIGDYATFTIYGTRTAFHSARLQRDFDRLYFGRIARS